MRNLSLSLLLLLPAALIAQQAPGAGGGGGGGGTSTNPGAGTPNPGLGGTGTTNPGRNPFPGTNPTDSNSRFPDLQQSRPIFISGKVMLEDGTPPPESVTIERICNGIARPEGYTNAKGQFSFELGRNTGMMADASTSGPLDDGSFGRGSARGISNPALGSLGGRSGISERDLIGCEIRANLPGFRGENVQLAGRRSLDNPDIGTIILRRLANVEGFTFSMTTALAPKEAKKSYEKGLELIKKKKMPEALTEMEKATAAYPKYAVAWFEQGRLYEMEKRAPDARRAFESSIAADSKYVKPYVNLAYLHAQEKDWAKTSEIAAKGIRLNPFEYPQLHYLNAVSNLNLGKIDEAEKSAREASKLDAKGQVPRVDQLLGVILAQKNDIQRARESFANYLKKDSTSPDADQVRKQMARLEAAVPPRPAAAPPRVQQEPVPAPPPAVSARTAWPSWSSGISDLPPGTLSKELDGAALWKEVGNSVYSLITAGDASQLKPESKEFQGAAVAVSNTLLVTNCDVLENTGSTGLYQNGKLITSTVRLVKSKRAAGMCVLEAGGARLQPVSGVRYAQDLSAGEKTYTVRAGELAEGTLQSAKLQGNIKLLVSNSPVTAATAGGGLFDGMGNLIGITTLRSQTAVLAIEEFFQ